MSYFRICLLLLLFSSTLVLYADENPGGKLYGYAFGDFFYKFMGDEIEASPSQYALMSKGINGIQFRRLHVYYDMDISDDFFTRILIEGNEETLTDGNTTVFVKEMYLQWRNIIPRHDISFGIIPTPTWSIGFPENIWQYRSIEKTITEFRNLGRATDFGVAVHGRIVPDGRIQYVGMIGSGRTLRFNDNAYKNYYLMVQARPFSDILVEGYIDRWMAAGGFHRSTYKIFAAYEYNAYTVGTEMLYQVHEHASVFEGHREVLGASIFIHGPVFTNVRAFGRYDYYEPDRNVIASGYRESFLVLGFDYSPLPDVRIMPNLWMNVFSPKSNAVEGKDTDIVFRISLLYSFK